MTLSKNGKKLGRKANWFRDSVGNTYEGLVSQTDGRYRIVETGERFTAANETEAIREFRHRQAKRKRETVTMLGPSDYLGAQTILSVDSPSFWQAVRNAILNTPKLVAERTGIEQIGYLRDLQPPERLPSFDEIIQTWNEHADCTQDHRRKVVRAFEDFRDTTGINSIDEIKSQRIVAFRDHVQKRDISRKQQQHIYQGIKGILRFIRDRDVAKRTITTALSELESLKLKKGKGSKKKLNPKPISRDEWDKLLRAATGPQDRAMILLMLNGAFYAREVIRLGWSDINGNAIITHRQKMGQCIRSCYLWDETLAALNSIKKTREEIFTNYAGEPLAISGAQRRFCELAKIAGVKVTASQLRDSAATRAAENNAPPDKIKVLLGHSCGMDDNYIARNPMLAKPATDAVYKFYFGETK